MELSKYLRDYSRTIPGKQQLLIGAYAKALEIIPRQLCDNAGFDATNILNKLRAKHAQVRKRTLFSIYPIFERDLVLTCASRMISGRHVVRRGHQQRGHRRQLCGVRLGTIYCADQRPDSGIRGCLSHSVC